MWCLTSARERRAVPQKKLSDRQTITQRGARPAPLQDLDVQNITGRLCHWEKRGHTNWAPWQYRQISWDTPRPISWLEPSTILNSCTVGGIVVVDLEVIMVFVSLIDVAFSKAKLSHYQRLLLPSALVTLYFQTFWEKLVFCPSITPLQLDFWNPGYSWIPTMMKNVKMCFWTNLSLWFI